MDRSRAGVRRVYDEIAEHFSKTRAAPWPEVEAFLEAAPAGDLGIDVGCGNARHVVPLSERVARVVGVDLSRRLLETARERVGTVPASVDLLQADAAALPLGANRATVAVYVATLHHLPDRAARIASLDELARVLAPGGRGLVSAWSTAHPRFDRETGFDATVDWTLPGGETVPRFYHVYDPEEFEADLEASDLRTVEREVSSGNCYATVAAKG